MQFLFANVIDHQRYDTLALSEWAFTDPLKGAGSLEGGIVVKREQVARVKRATVPDVAAIYAVEDGKFLWGGPVIDRVWNSKNRTLKIVAAQWESWFYTRAMGDSSYMRVNQDRVLTAEELVRKATTGLGTPNIAFTTRPKAPPRATYFNRFRWYGEMLDILAGDDPGFDWSIQVRRSAQTGDIEPYVQFWYPERTTGVRPVLLSTGDQGGNIIAYSEPENATERRLRVWALGAGQLPDQYVAKDEDPSLGQDNSLLRESISTYSNIADPRALFNLARAERVARNFAFKNMTIDVKPTNPDPTSFLVGDRCRLKIEDEWTKMDLPAAKITERTLRGVRDEIRSMSLSVDVTDIDVPGNTPQDDNPMDQVG